MTNIAYSALTSLITKNSKERVQMGSYRFIFAFSTSLLIQTITVGFVDWCGGDAAAWRLVAIIYAIVGLVVNTISGLSVKELPEEELNDGEPKKTEEKYSLVQAFKLLIKNKYYIMILVGTPFCSSFTVPPEAHGIWSSRGGTPATERPRS